MTFPTAAQSTTPLPAIGTSVSGPGKLVVTLSGCIFTPWWDVPVLLTPAAGGGSNFNPTCCNPNTGYVYVMCNEQDTAYYMGDRVNLNDNGFRLAAGAFQPAINAFLAGR